MLNGILANHRVRSVAAFFWVLLLVGAFVRSLPETYEVRDNDFCAYYDAGRVVGQGQSQRLYNPEFEPDRNTFTNLPIVSLLVVPLGRMPYATAWHVFWWLQLLSYAATAALLLLAVHRFFGPLTPGRVAIVMTIVWMFAPVMRRSLILGQTTPMMVMLFALFYLLYRSDMRLLAGAVLGMIWVIKIPPLILLPLFVLRRRLAPVLVALIVAAGAVVLSAAVFDADRLAQYANRVIFSNVGGAMAAFNNQSLDGALMRLWTGMSLTQWTPVPRPIGVMVLWLLVMVPMVAWLLRVSGPLLMPRQKPDDADVQTGSLEIELALAAVLMVLVFPVTWIHYYLFLMVPLTLLPFWWEQRQLPRPAWLLVLFVVSLCLVCGTEVRDNAYYLAHSGDIFFRLAQNLRPFGALLLVGILSVGILMISKRSHQQRAETGCAPFGSGR